jgi:hypothetical protein
VTGRTLAIDAAIAVLNVEAQPKLGNVESRSTPVDTDHLANRPGSAVGERDGLAHGVIAR